MKATSRWAYSIALLILLQVTDALASTQKYAVILGNNLGHDRSKELRYAEQDASKFRNVLVDIGGFKSEDVKLILSGDAREAWATIKQMEQRLVARKSESNSKALFLFYYSGHADGDVLELGLSSLKYSQLLKYLQSSAADVRLAFLDSCQSGNLIAVKGGHRGPEYNIHVTDEITSKGYAIITSSSYNELSQESLEIHGAFFTHYLISALRGAGDESKDGKVTLNEAYKYAYARTLARTSSTIGTAQHPMYEFKLQGRGEIVLTNTDRTGTCVAVNLPESGRLLLLDELGNSILAEAEIKANERTSVAVRPGSYRAYLLTENDLVRYAQIEIPKATSGELKADDFQTIELAESFAKGGLFNKHDAELVHRLGGGGIWRKWPLKDAISSYGSSVHYRLLLPSGIEPAAKLTWTTRQDVGLSTGYYDVGISLGIGYAIPLSFFVLRTELLAGYEQLIQSERLGKKRTTPALDYLLLAGLELPLGDVLFSSLDVAGGGRIFEIVNAGIVHRFDLQVVLSLGLKWID